MIQKRSDNTYHSSLLTSLGISHAYSTRSFGDMRRLDSKEKFLTAVGESSAVLTMGEQVHGTKIVTVGDKEKGKTLDATDGLLHKKNGSRALLGVTFADCVPVLAVDPKSTIIGTAHAGWKGTLVGVTRELITAMTEAGATAKDIYVSIGPHIGMCCYNVREDRAMSFQKQFGNDEKVTSQIQGEWHLDIGYANYLLLLASGIEKDHIDAPPTCTSCQVSEFNSFRKDAKDAFGVQLGVISI